ncbi:hypothetical protein AB5N19_01091 [Seiridium cardinale]
MSNLPIVLLGKSEPVGASVIQNLKPEYEVTHFMLSSEAAIAELPFVLKGQEPPTKSSEIGSGNYSTPPKAIIFGGGYDGSATDEILSGIGSTNVLLKSDQSIPMPPIGPEYGQKILERCKGKLGELTSTGKLDERQGGSFFY